MRILPDFTEIVQVEDQRELEEKQRNSHTRCDQQGGPPPTELPALRLYWLTNGGSRPRVGSAWVRTESHGPPQHSR